MLALSQTIGCAILALSCLEGCGERWVLAKSISDCTGITLPYLSKLLHAMTSSGLIEAKRGYRGGSRLTRPRDEITLLDVVAAVDGSDWACRCLLGLEGCSDDRACPVHVFWKQERARIEKELKRRTLRDVAEFERKRGLWLVCSHGEPDA